MQVAGVLEIVPNQTRCNPRGRQYADNTDNSINDPDVPSTPTSIPTLPLLSPSRQLSPPKAGPMRTTADAATRTPSAPSAHAVKRATAEQTKDEKAAPSESAETSCSRARTNFADDTQALGGSTGPRVLSKLEEEHKVVIRSLFASSKAPKILVRLSAQEQEDLISKCRPTEYCQGQVVVKQKQAWPYCCIIASGGVQVSKAKQGILGNMGAGQWFGDLRSPIAMANVMTNADTVFALFAQEDLDAVMNQRLIPSQPQGSRTAANCTEAERYKPRRKSCNQPLLNHMTFFNKSLGRGTFGTVYPCVDPEGEFTAVKCISKDKVVCHQAQTQSENEIRLLQEMQTPFIVQLHNTLQDNRCVYLQLELVPGGEFFKFLVRQGTVSEPHCQFYTANVICALRHMHEKHVVFRDLKPENLVFGANGYLKLVDFGFAKKLSSHRAQTETICGTPDYMAPEIIVGKGHGKMVDMWSLGVLTYEMLTGKTPYNEPSGDVYKIYKLICNTRLRFPPGFRFSQALVAFVSALLFANPQKRLGFDLGFVDVGKHAWYERTTFDWAGLDAQTTEAPCIPLVQDASKIIENASKIAYEDIHTNLLNTPVSLWNLKLD